MIELLLLELYKDFNTYRGKKLDSRKYTSRLTELRGEFLEKYAETDSLS